MYAVQSGRRFSGSRGTQVTVVGLASRVETRCVLGTPVELYDARQHTYQSDHHDDGEPCATHLSPLDPVFTAFEWHVFAVDVSGTGAIHILNIRLSSEQDVCVVILVHASRCRDVTQCQAHPPLI